MPVEESNEDGMQIDEEGRPRFAPARDIVRTLALPYLSHVLTSSLGSRYQSRDAQDSYSSSPNDTSETIMDLYLPASG